MKSTQFCLDQQPLCVLASPGSCIYAIYPKCVATYTQSVKTAEFILNEPIKHWSLYLYTLFICYQSNKIERRQLFAWEDPVDLGVFKEVKKIKAQNQRQLIVIFEDHFLVIEITQNRKTIKKISFEQPINIIQMCCRFQSEENKANLCFVLQSKTRISKFQLVESKAVWRSSLNTETDQIIYMTTINFYPQFIRAVGQYLLVVYKSYQICLFLLFDKQFIPKVTFNLKEIIGSEYVHPSNSIGVHYNPQSRNLFVKANSHLYSVTFLRKHSMIILPTPTHFVSAVKIYEYKEGTLVCSNKESAVLQIGLSIYEVKIIGQSQEIQIQKEIVRQKKTIASEIQNFSRKLREDRDRIPIDPIDLQSQLERKTSLRKMKIQEDQEDFENMMRQVSNYRVDHDEQVFEGELEDNKEANNINEEKQEIIQNENSQLNKIEEQKQISQPKQQQTKEQPTSTKQIKQKEPTKQQSVRQVPKYVLDQILRQFKQMKSLNTKQAETQTQQFINFYLDQIEEQVTQRIQRFVSTVQQDLNLYTTKIAEEVADFKAVTESYIHQYMKNNVTKEIKLYISELYAPKLQKYVSITFNKLKQIIQQTNSCNMQQINKEKIKQREINRHLIDKNKQIMEKVMQIIRTSITKFEQKKSEMTSDLEAKSNLLNDLTLQVEELIKKFQDQAKQFGKVDFQNKISDLLLKIQQSTIIVKKRIESLGTPTILENAESKKQSSRRENQYPQQYQNPNPYPQYYTTQPYYPTYPQQNNYGPPPLPPIPSPQYSYPPTQLQHQPPTNNYSPPYQSLNQSAIQPHLQYQYPYPYQPQAQLLPQYPQPQPPPISYQVNNLSNYPNPDYQINNQSFVRSSTISSILHQSQPQLHRQLSNPQLDVLNQSAFLKTSKMSNT